MNYLFLTVLLTIPFSSFCQDTIPETPQDTTNTALILFKYDVQRIEFVKVEPFCESKLRWDETTNQDKMVKVCWPETVISGKDIEGVWVKSFSQERLSGNITIASVDADSLLRILYETKPSKYLTMCYEPRHGILFYGENDEVIGFVELCFECERHVSTFGIPEFSNLNYVAYIQLQNMFYKYGFE